MDIIRVIRIYEFIGPRDVVEEQIANSIHGERRIPKPSSLMVIRAATLGNYPEILCAEDASDYNLHVYVCGSTDLKAHTFAGPFAFLEDALNVQPNEAQASNGAYIYRVEANEQKAVFWYNRAVNAWLPEQQR